MVTSSVWINWGCSAEAKRAKLIYKSAYFHFIVLSLHFSLLKVLPPYQLPALCSVSAVSQLRETAAGLQQLCQGWSFAPALTLQEERESQPGWTCSSPPSGQPSDDRVLRVSSVSYLVLGGYCLLVGWKRRVRERKQFLPSSCPQTSPS